MAEDFLSRWSRRKLDEKRGEPEERHEKAPAETEAEAEPAQSAELAEGEAPRHPAEDVDLDSLTKDSDFSIFMQKGVPPLLKQKALRKLWTSDPVFANLDGLDDYFDLAKPKIHGLGPMRGTSWRIGRGFLTDLELGIKPEEPTEAEAEAEPVAELDAGPVIEDGEEEQDAPETAAADVEADVEAEAEESSKA